MGLVSGSGLALGAGCAVPLEAQAEELVLGGAPDGARLGVAPRQVVRVEAGREAGEQRRQVEGRLVRGRGRVRGRVRVRVRVKDRGGVAHPDAPTCGTVTSTGVGWLSPLATPLPRADEPRPRPRPG